MTSLEVVVEDLTPFLYVFLSHFLLKFFEIDGIALLPRRVLYVVHPVSTVLGHLGDIKEHFFVKVNRDGLSCLANLDFVILLDFVVVENLGADMLTLASPMVIVNLTILKSLGLVPHGI